MIGALGAQRRKLLVERFLPSPNDFRGRESVRAAGHVDVLIFTNSD